MPKHEQLFVLMDAQRPLGEEEEWGGEEEEWGGEEEE